MKKTRFVLFTFVGMLIASFVSAQTADEIITKYLQAIGGKDKISAITSLYTEGSMEVMGMTGVIKSTVLNGKGSRQDIEIMGATITSCFTETDGWSINPMAGGSSAETMPQAQYDAGKEQIFVGAPFLGYAEKGYKVELLGTEAVDGANAYKIKMTSPSNVAATYFFDEATSLLVKAIQQSEMQGQMTENETFFSDYRDAGGMLQPFKMLMNMAGGQVSMNATITKIEVNKPVDMAFFAKP
jgi:hypothetical protein